MTLHVNIQRGTNAGTRRPHTEGHAPTCACTRCTQPPNIIPLAATTTTCTCGQRVHTLTTGRTTHTLDAPIHGLTAP